MKNETEGIWDGSPITNTPQQHFCLHHPPPPHFLKNGTTREKDATTTASPNCRFVYNHPYHHHLHHDENNACLLRWYRSIDNALSQGLPNSTRKKILRLLVFLISPLYHVVNTIFLTRHPNAPTPISIFHWDTICNARHHFTTLLLSARPYCRTVLLFLTGNCCRSRSSKEEFLLCNKGTI